MVESQERQVARKIKVSSILNERFVKQEGMSPSYIVHNSAKIARVNVVGIVISKDSNDLYEGMVIDDGSGAVSVRSFEKKKEFENFSVGDVVMLIGKIREYGGERYIVKEIVRKVDKKWIDLRRLELAISDSKNGEREVDENIEDDIVEEEMETPSKKVFDMIKKLDSGSGADFDDIVKDSGVENGERIIEELLKAGHVFEIRPGKLKVLE